jgi:hypothetical protein
MKRIFLLSAVITLMIAKVVAQPIVSAPTPPARSASNVISIFSGAYTDISGTNFNPNWGQSGFGAFSEITVGATDLVKKYGNMNYQGWEFTPAISAASMTNLHLDIWTSDCTALDVFLIDFVAPEQKVTVTTTLSGWTSIDIPLTSYTRPITNVGQFKFVAAPAGATVYLDNVYFWTAATLPTITGFSVPAKVVGNAPFTITDPVSNSTGAFSYTSSNTSVATISGNTVTITGSGTSTITAIQAAAGIYASGSTTTSLVVTYNPPAVAAPTPATPTANVISLFSNTYTNRAVDTWSAIWDQADVADVVIAGNDAKLYTNLNFSGIEFTGANVIDATAMLYYHVDVWTPNSSPIKVKLVDFGADGAFAGGDDVSSIEYVLSPAPTPGVWSSYNIPLADFTGLTTKAHLAQMLFVGSATTIYVDNIYLSSIPTTFNPLPVTLSDFKAAKRGNTTSLSWKTLSETNSKGFSLERSGNGINWAPLQFINESGTTTATKQYTTVDNSPLKGINYYRLNQIDIDGKQSYSGIVSVNFSAPGTTGFTFYPNPAKNNLVVSLETISGNTAGLQLVNADGKIVKSITLNKQSSNTNIVLDIAHLNKGVYILLLRDRETVKTSRVVIN